MYRLAALCAVCFSLAAAGVAGADLVVKVGDMEASFFANADWTLNRLTKSGKVLVDGYGVGSSQGTVMMIDEHWAGAGHRNTWGESQSLLIDGVSQPVANGASYTAQKGASFQRTTLLGGAIRLDSTMNLFEDYTYEWVELSVVNPQVITRKVYGFLGSRQKNLNHYAFYGADGQRLGMGVSNAKDDTTISFPGACGVAQYDPISGQGIYSLVYASAGLNLEMFIADRITDNKLYCRLPGIEGPQVANAKYQLGQEVFFFSADMNDWQNASDINSLLPEPSSMAFLGLSALGILRRRKAG